MITQVQTYSRDLPQALGQSDSFLEFQEQISQVAPVDRPVLILGERGTGKELAAARIHYLSKRWQKPLVTLNCAALTPGLIGTELFGNEKGAFTGAGTRRIGRFEMASDGTLFLDEIGAIPMEVQEKILRVVEYGCFERVGSSVSIQVDTRIVAAANVDLSAMAAAGRFKQDLLDRLSFEVVYVPPLRHREGDICLLADHFAQRMAVELGRQSPPELALSAQKKLLSHSWPGNIRELKNVVERAVYKSDTHVITRIDFDPFQSPAGWELASAPPTSDTRVHAGDSSSGSAEKPFKAAVSEFECQLLSQALNACRFHQKQTAEKLGLTYDQLRGLMKKYADQL